MHHAFDIVALFADALVIVEEGKTGGVDRLDKCVGEECEELLHHAHPHGKHSVVLNTNHEKEALGDAGQPQLDDEGEEPKHARQDHRRVVDQVAATMILQSFLDRRSDRPDESS